MALRSDDIHLVGVVPDGLVDVSESGDGNVDIRRDRELVERCQAGDATAFDVLYRRYHRRLFRFCLQRLRDQHEAEDAAQEAFAKAWRALPNFAGERRFYPWLTVIAANQCVDIQRRRRRQTPVDDAQLQAADVAHDDAEDALVRQADAQMVSAAFAKLSSRHQRVLGLREGSGWSYQAIAEHEGVGVAAVETLLWRARQALKREFAVMAGPESRVGGFIALVLALPRRLVARVAVPLRHAAAVGQHMVVGEEPAASYVPQMAVATGAVAVAVGTALMLSGAAARPQVPVRPVVAVPSHASPTAGSTTGTHTVPPSSTAGAGGTATPLRPATSPVPPSSGPSPAPASGTGSGPGTSSGLSNTLNSTSSGLSNTLNSTSSGLSNTLNSTSSGLSNTLNSTSSGLSNTLNSTSSGLSNTLNSTSSGLSNTLNSTSSGLSNTLDSTSSGLLGSTSG
ncbi:MAG: sigma-70 family RNA polymerase sigma factor [Actinomycetota bacterium]|nr:sigma-70 family RNA polymerase sigma factor [Actinomycetota bacterium]